ncbi:hypothetical protein O3P69_010944 [Scylla paramamosain]|uniref:Uncharacterized protein n=1 Tax=Scylla paramamosain TaxID=85552 RepID=A0AAW0SBR0_SCYPA
MAQYHLNWGEAPGCVRGNPEMEQATLEEVVTGTPARDHVEFHPPLPSPPATAPRISALTAPASLKTSVHPLSPPYELVEENVGRLEKWLLEEFGCTVFATEQSSRYLINEQWGRTLRDRERAMIQTSVNSSIWHDQQAHSLTPLRPGQRARIQNPSSRWWDRVGTVGTVLELSAPRQYLLRLDGSGRASIRNRCHLRPLTGEPQLSDDSNESPTPVRITTPRPRRTQQAPRHLDDYFLNSPV